VNRDPAFDELRKIVTEKSRPIVFWTGAGVSRPALPTWAGLLNEVIKVAKAKAATLRDNKNLLSSIDYAKGQNDLWRSFERLASSEVGIGSESFRSVIVDTLGVSNSSEIPLVQQLLWKFKPKGIVTLNLDLFTQRSSIELGQHVPVAIHPSQFGANVSIFKEQRHFIAYPHGALDDPGSWTFTSSALKRRLEDPEYLAWVTTLLASYTVVFVGITADDIAVGGLMDQLVANNRTKFRGNYWITERNDVATDTWAEERGIRVIRYSVDGNDHSDLLKMLQEMLDYRPIENPDLEIPILASADHITDVDIPPAEQIDLRDKELVRGLLNTEANRIFKEYQSSPSEVRDKRFKQFLEEYDDAIHNAYHTSTAPGKNKFLGYHLIARADGGAFGNVFQATNDEGKIVAIKVLHADKLGNADFYKNFRRGVNSLRILADRRVDGIVNFIEAVEIPPSLIMEWIDGATLAQAAHQPALDDWSVRVAILHKLATILAHSHALPERVLHRDLRPANIMLRDFYTEPEKLDVVVLDFDLSWHKGAEDHSVMYSPAMGYLAPEQRRHIGRTTARSALVDSYGFGMVAYFLVARHDPIPDQHLIANWGESLVKIARANACQRLRCAPARVMRLIYRCTLEQQSMRTQISQVAGELQNILDYFDNPETATSVSLLTEELAARAEHMAGYAWQEETSSATVSHSAERATSLTADIANHIIHLKVDWQNAGTQDWGQVNRLLDRGVPKLVDQLKANGWNVSVNKQSRSFYVHGTIDAWSISGDIAKYAKDLDRALNHVSAMAGM